MTDNPFLGTWRLISWENRDADGQLGYPLGPDALGYLTYTADGYIFAQIMAAERAPLATQNPFGGADAEAEAAARAHMSYCGTYEVRAGGENDEVVHRVAVSDFPNWVGGEQLRFYKFEDEKLILSAPPFQTKKGEITTFLIWERAKP
jgi:hypothetical protein